MAENKLHTKPIAEEVVTEATKAKPNYKKIGKTILWSLLAIATIVLFSAAMQKKEEQLCADIKIEITGTEKEMFINENDVIDLINAQGNVKKRKMGTVDLMALETALQKNLWIKHANLFFDNNRLLHINIEEREPIARVFTEDGQSFYVDSTALRLPLSEKLSARVPVFTGFPTNKAVLSNPDSALLRGLTDIGKYIYADSFWMAQTAQVNITPQASFELIPLIGNHVVVLGNANDIEDKFNRLYTFYKQAWLQNGINTYSSINVQFNNQVVAVRSGKENAAQDSSAAIKSNLIDSVAAIKAAKIVKADLLKAVTAQKAPLKKINFAAQQNKQSNAALSVSKKPLKPVLAKPDIGVAKPKAVLNKKN